MGDAVLLARVRDYLFENGPAPPHEVADACEVPVSLVLRMVREGALEEVRPAEITACESCNAHGIVGKLCPACRRKFTPAGDGEPAPERRRPEPAVVSQRRERQRFHMRRH